MSRIIWAAYASDYDGSSVIAAYEREEDAKAMAEICSAYLHNHPPPESPDAEYDDPAWESHAAAYRAWESAHPGGSHATFYRNYSWAPIELRQSLADGAKQV